MPVEVFKTNVSTRTYANKLLNHIHKAFTKYNANFDLEDCDNILRVQCTRGSISSKALILFLKDLGCCAETLPD